MYCSPTQHHHRRLCCNRTILQALMNDCSDFISNFSLHLIVPGDLGFAKITPPWDCLVSSLTDLTRVQVLESLPITLPLTCCSCVVSLTHVSNWAACSSSDVQICPWDLLKCSWWFTGQEQCQAASSRPRSLDPRSLFRQWSHETGFTLAMGNHGLSAE